MKRRLHVAVGDDCAAALVLAPDRRDFMGERDRKLRKAAMQELPHPQLVIPIDVREQETDGDCDAPRRILRQPSLDLLRQLLKSMILKRDDGAAVEIQALIQS